MTPAQKTGPHPVHHIPETPHPATPHPWTFKGGALLFGGGAGGPRGGVRATRDGGLRSGRAPGAASPGEYYNVQILNINTYTQINQAINKEQTIRQSFARRRRRWSERSARTWSSTRRPMRRSGRGRIYDHDIDDIDNISSKHSNY